MSRSFRHDPVLVRESIAWLRVRPGDRVVDATVGGGGHAEAILEASAPDGRLLGMDLDEEALAHADSANDLRLMIKLSAEANPQLQDQISHASDDSEMFFLQEEDDFLND